MTLSENYVADIEYNYYVGGYTDEKYLFRYTRKFSDIENFDESILIASNIDDALTKTISLSFPSYAVPNELIPQKNDDFETANITWLGTALVTFTSFHDNDPYNLTKHESHNAWSNARFCIGNPDSGFKDLCVIPWSCHLIEKERQSIPLTTGAPNYAPNTDIFTPYELNDSVYQNALTVQYMHVTSTEYQQLQFPQYRVPEVCVLYRYDGDLWIATLSGLISGFQSANNTLPVTTTTLGTMTDDTLTICRETDRPVYMPYPDNNDVTYYFTGYGYNRRSLYVNAPIITMKAFARLINISGLYYVPRSENLTASYVRENICLGSRDDTNNIPQDVYNKGIDNIKNNDKYADLTYDIIPETKHDEPMNDEIDPMIISGMSYVGGYNLYALTSSELYEVLHPDDLPEGFNLSECIITVKASPYNLNSFIKSYRETPFAVAGKVLSTKSYTFVTNTLNFITLASFHVTPIHNNYLDYAPYTSYELYIPCCGWLTLTDFVNDKDIEIILTYDINNASCKAHVMCNGLEIATKTGTFAGNIPVSVTESGIQKSAMTSASLSMAGGALSLVSGIATSNPVSMSMGALSCANAVSQSIITSNSNYNSVVGNTGDLSETGDESRVEFKRTTVNALNEKIIAEKYGKPCNKFLELSTLSGMTVVDNFITSGLTCMESEKQKIKSMFTSGVII